MADGHSSIRSVTIDCRDPEVVARFWAASLGGQITDVDEEGAVMERPDGSPRLLFIRVPDGKSVKNRLHFDLTPPDTRDAEVERLKSLGARVLEGFGGPEATWVVMADPEGNEFCVERGESERLASQRAEAT